MRLLDGSFYIAVFGCRCSSLRLGVRSGLEEGAVLWTCVEVASRLAGKLGVSLYDVQKSWIDLFTRGSLKCFSLFVL